MMRLTRLVLNCVRPQVEVCLIVLIACVMVQASLRDSGGETADMLSEKGGAQVFTVAQERALGARLAYCYALRHKTVEDELYRQRITRVASRLQKAAGAPGLKIAVVKGDEMKAVSFPGGRVFLTTGLMKELVDDDELAAVLAHEAAHSAARHTTRLISRALDLPAGAREGFPTREQILTGAVLNFEFPAALEDTANAFEREADSIALGWLEAASYRQTALSGLLERIAARLPSCDSGPHTDALFKRIATLDREARR